MRKRSKYRPSGANPLAHLVALHGVQVIDTDEAAKRATKLRLAVDALCRGQGDRQDWCEVFDAINLVEAWDRRKVVDAGDEIERMQEVVVLAAERRKATGATGLTAAERQALQGFAADFAALLSGVTCSELYVAEAAVRERVRQVLRTGAGKGVHVLEAV